MTRWWYIWLVGEPQLHKSAGRCLCGYNRLWVDEWSNRLYDGPTLRRMPILHVPIAHPIDHAGQAYETSDAPELLIWISLEVVRVESKNVRRYCSWDRSSSFFAGCQILPRRSKREFGWGSLLCYWMRRWAGPHCIYVWEIDDVSPPTNRWS